MPIGYLITTSLVACGVLGALAPPRRPFIVGVLSFVAGFALSELPFIAAAWLVVATLLALDQTGLGSPAGVAAAAVAVLAMAGLLLVIRRALLTGAALDRALTAGLGAGWRGSVGATRTRRRIMSGRVLFAPFWMRRPGVTRIANVSYGDAGRANLLDLYHGRAGTAGKPVLIHLHGGALFMGRKNRESLPLLYRLASQGWVCISANYRLRPAVTFPDHLIDVKKVIAWAREHARDYGADPSVVLVAGSSSGGQLAALAALTSNDPRYQPGFEHADTSVNAAICLHGYYGQPGSQDTEPFSPLAYPGAGAPPMFIAHGDRDSLIPVETARLFAERIRRGSASPVIYAELPGAQHGFDRFHSIRFEQIVDAVEDFAAWVRLPRAVRVLAGVGGSPRVDGLEAPLIGRDAELRTIRELFHAAAERRVPRLGLVSGPAGVGKSRLGWEFFKYIDGLVQEVWWHRGRCLSYGEGVRSGRWPRSSGSGWASPRRIPPMSPRPS